MAKDLPYFKFFCSEWTDGDITLEDYRVQGLFINVCSYYWSNNCDVSIVKLKKKFKQESETIDYLIKEDLIKVKGQDILISFLDEQLDERIETSKIKSKGGKASAEARKLKKLEQEKNKNLTENEHVLNSCSTETQLLREDKRREEEKREENISHTDFLKLNHSKEFEAMRMNLRGIDEKEFLDFLNNKCIMEDIPMEFKKINARFNLLKSNWNKEKKSKETPVVFDSSKLNFL